MPFTDSTAVSKAARCTAAVCFSFAICRAPFRQHIRYAQRQAGQHAVHVGLRHGHHLGQHLPGRLAVPRRRAMRCQASAPPLAVGHGVQLRAQVALGRGQLFFDNFARAQRLQLVQDGRLARAAFSCSMPLSMHKRPVMAE